MKRWLILLCVQLALALGVTFENQALLVPLALLPVVILDPGALRILLRWKLLLFLVLMVVGIPLVAGTRSGSLLGLPYSPEYIGISVVMAHRSVIILLALRLFTRRISLDDLSRRARGTRFRCFGEVFVLATELLPSLRGTAHATYREYRLSMPRRGIVGHTMAWTIELMARALVDAERLHTNEIGK